VRRHADFQRIQGKDPTDGAAPRPGRATTAHYVFLVARGLERDAPSRLGLVVTKKLGNAVVRNRVKRVCRECFRLWPDLLPNGVDLLVIARHGAGELGLLAARDEWARVADVLRRRARTVLAHTPDEPHVPAAPSVSADDRPLEAPSFSAVRDEE
jgi:ribonuclease P protein component